MDVPNERSLHASPIPRTGGLGIVLGFASGWLMLSPFSLLFVLVPALLLCALSFIDDTQGLSVRLRFLLHFLAALAFLYLSGVAASAAWLTVFLLFGIVWSTNLFNFMDGSNGLAGGMAFFGFSFYGLGAWLAGDQALAAACVCIAVSALAFLRYNFANAKLFMGDSGSIPLGFIAACLGILGCQRGLWSWIFPLLVFSPFIFDATVTLARRLLRGEKFWQAHRQHCYQRLVLMGWSHQLLAINAYALMVGCGLSAYASLGAPWPFQALIIAIWIVFYGVLLLRVDHAWSQFSNGAKP